MSGGACKIIICSEVLATHAECAGMLADRLDGISLGMDVSTYPEFESELDAIIDDLERANKIVKRSLDRLMEINTGVTVARLNE